MLYSLVVELRCLQNRDMELVVDMVLNDQICGQGGVERGADTNRGIVTTTELETVVRAVLLLTLKFCTWLTRVVLPLII